MWSRRFTCCYFFAYFWKSFQFHSSWLGEGFGMSPKMFVQLLSKFFLPVKILLSGKAQEFCPSEDKCRQKLHRPKLSIQLKHDYEYRSQISFIRSVSLLMCNREAWEIQLPFLLKYCEKANFSWEGYTYRPSNTAKFQ